MPDRENIEALPPELICYNQIAEKMEKDMVDSTVESSPKTLSFAEYLVYEVEHGVRYELYRGQLIEMATTGLHTNICEFLSDQFRRYFSSQKMRLIAKAFTGVRTEEKTSRIPDVVVCTHSLWKVVEVTSQNWRQDYFNKRAEYDRINIPEYWIVDPNQSRIRLCSKFSGEEIYSVRDFLPGDDVQSVQFPGFTLPVNQVLSPPVVEELFQEEQELRQQLEQRADEEHQRAEEERQRAEAANQRAEGESERAEAEQELRQQIEQQRNAERQRAEQLAQRLRALGINPDTIN